MSKNKCNQFIVEILQTASQPRQTNLIITTSETMDESGVTLVFVPGGKTEKYPATKAPLVPGQRIHEFMSHFPYVIRELTDHVNKISNDRVGNHFLQVRSSFII